MTDEQIEMLGTGQLGDILGSGQTDEMQGSSADEISETSGSEEDLEGELSAAAQEMEDICVQISHLATKLETLESIANATKIPFPWGTFQQAVWKAAGLPEGSEEIEVVLASLQKWVWAQGFDMAADGSWIMDWEGGRRHMTWIEFVVAMLE